jgi:hypothetical protein
MNTRLEVQRDLTRLKKIYYPGSGKDSATLNFILSEFRFIEDIFFCDYLEHLELEEMNLNTNWEVLNVIPLTPQELRRNSWQEFWFDHENSEQFAQPNHKDSNLFILHNKLTHKLVRFFQFGTEGVGTYQALLDSRKRPNLIILADHGFGCNWSPNIWGEPESFDERISYLKELATDNNFILVDSKSTNPWLEYAMIYPFNETRWSLYQKQINQKH